MNNTELVQSYRQQINNTLNQFNLQLFWNMYNRCGSTYKRTHTHTYCFETPLLTTRSLSVGGTWR